MKLLAVIATFLATCLCAPQTTNPLGPFPVDTILENIGVAFGKAIIDATSIQSHIYTGKGLAVATALAQDLNVGLALRTAGLLVPKGKYSSCLALIGLYTQLSENLHTAAPIIANIANTDPFNTKYCSVKDTCRIQINGEVKDLAGQFALLGTKLVSAPISSAITTACGKTDADKTVIDKASKDFSDAILRIGKAFGVGA